MTTSKEVPEYMLTPGQRGVFCPEDGALAVLTTDGIIQVDPHCSWKNHRWGIENLFSENQITEEACDDCDSAFARIHDFDGEVIPLCDSCAVEDYKLTVRGVCAKDNPVEYVPAVFCACPVCVAAGFPVYLRLIEGEQSYTLEQ